tara:strand:- start:7287 stop:8855 length:1569 start_codon:yes stop_codon:yes gene_type:complete
VIKENEDIKASSFTQELPEDPSQLNQSRIVEKACFSRVNPEKFPHGSLVHTNPLLQAEMGLENLNERELLALTLGAHPDTEGKTFAMCYGGHQFGQWAGQLGDGRAINIGEVENEGRGYALQIKGSGPTPYSRRADGNAVLRSSIREYLCSESMFHLGVPTTRALSLALSGNKVRRDPMYDGNPLDEKGAIVCRVAPSFIRFGNFQILAAREDKENLEKLLKYTIKHHFPEIEGDLKTQAVSLLKAVADKTREMIIHWQRVGFVHGVMNTDNMSIHGVTIDYGPYGWLENYDEEWTPNTTDAQNKRYGFQKQLKISLWNLLQLANGLYPLVDDAAPLEDILHEYDDLIMKEYHQMMCAKLGLENWEETGIGFVKQLRGLLTKNQIDYIMFFRLLTEVDSYSEEEIKALLEKTSYQSEEVLKIQLDEWVEWFSELKEHVQKEGSSKEERAVKMNLVNPKYVLRNYMAQLAIEAADEGDNSVLNELFELLKNPYDEQPKMEKWFAKRPDWALEKVGCSMLSCSS